MELRRIAVVTSVALGIGTAGAGSAGAAGVEDLGATPQICNVFAPTPNRFYAAVSGTDTFNFGSHILFRGQELSGTYRWEIGGQGDGEFASYGQVTVLAGGSGLKRASSGKAKRSVTCISARVLHYL
jgi:hypothetical protein